MKVTARLVVVWLAMVVVLALIVWGVWAKPTVRGSARSVAGSSHQAVSQSPSGSASRGTTSPPSGSASRGTASPSGSASPGPGGWKLKFNADFTGSQLNKRMWGTCYPRQDAAVGCTNFGNREYEWYLRAQDRVVNGALELAAQRLPTHGRNRHGNPMTYECRSGMVTTYPSFRFTYGYVQIVARIPYGYGLWPALWLAAANLKWPPEIDIMEHTDNFSQVGEFFHPVGYRPFSNRAHPGNLSVGWHSFGLLWSRSELVWFIDGHKELTVDQYIPDIPMYLVANVAEKEPVLANHGCDGSMLIRSVKVWQQH